MKKGGLPSNRPRKLSHELRTAEDRIAELEAEVGAYQDKADRAEQPLHKVYTEIEDRFLQQDNGRRGVNGARHEGRASSLSAWKPQARGTRAWGPERNSGTGAWRPLVRHLTLQ
jgi:hypothetical protein